MKTKTKSTRKAVTVTTACDTACDPTPKKPRRSIPVAEVNQIIDREVARVKAERTLYDDRNEIIRQIDDVNGDIHYHEENLHTLRRRELQLKLELQQTNTAITRELDLDELR